MYGIRIGRHIDASKAPRLSRDFIGDEEYTTDFTRAGEEFPQVLASDRAGNSVEIYSSHTLRLGREMMRDIVKMKGGLAPAQGYLTSGRRRHRCRCHRRDFRAAWLRSP